MHVGKVLIGCVVILLLLALIIVVFGGTDLLLYLDIPSLAMVLVIPGILTFLHGGPSEFGGALALAFGRESNRLEKAKALALFRYCGHATLLTGGIGFITGMIAVLANIEDKASVGPNLAVAIITLLYSLLIDLLIIQPMVYAFRKELAIDEAEADLETEFGKS